MKRKRILTPEQKAARNAWQKEWIKKNPEQRKKRLQWAKEWRQKNRAQVRAIRKDWAKRNPDKIKLSGFKASLKRNYGISYEEWLAMVKAQKGRCSICKSKQSHKDNNGNPKRLSIDHNHSTGKIRGLICQDCNLAIGHMKDSPRRLRAAALYIENGGDASCRGKTRSRGAVS